MLLVFQIWAFTMVPEAKIYFGDPPIPDVRVGGYTPADIRGLLLKIGEKGRETYLLAQRKIDWVVPTLGIGMFVMGIWALADGMIIWGRRWSSPRAYALECIGSINGIFDYSENALIAQAMRAGPYALNSTSIKMASICTTLKFTFGSISIILIFVLAVLRWRQFHSNTFGS
jgi:hypothetical protein